jgi:hypothetical protein
MRRRNIGAEYCTGCDATNSTRIGDCNDRTPWSPPTGIDSRAGRFMLGIYLVSAAFQRVLIVIRSASGVHVSATTISGTS